MTLTRMDFLKATVAAAAAGILGCGDDESSEPTGGTGTGGGSGGSTSTSTTSTTSTTTTTAGAGGGGGQGGGSAGSCLDNGTVATIAANHGHTLVVTKEEVAAGVEMTYDITGSSMHSHSVTITAADFTELQGNQSIMVTSTSGGGGHTHAVTVSCA